MAATSSVTAVPLTSGVTVAVHTLPAVSSVKAEAAPLPTVTSPTTKPFTGSLKVNVAVKGPLVVAPLTSVLIPTVGAVLSTS